MNKIDIREIETACTQLSIAYARHVDFGAYDDFVDLFTETAVLELGFKLDGRDAIRTSMSKRSPQLRSRHILTNIFIEVENAERATGVSYLTLYRHIGAESLQATPVEFQTPAAVGHYADEFRLTEQGWRIAHRRLQLAFRNPDHF